MVWVSEMSRSAHDIKDKSIFGAPLEQRIVRSLLSTFAVMTKDCILRLHCPKASHPWTITPSCKTHMNG